MVTSENHGETALFCAFCALSSAGCPINVKFNAAASIVRCRRGKAASHALQL